MPSVPLSIVVPCYNEEGCLAELHRRLSAAAQAVVGDAYEIVLINDGSKDRTWPIMQELAESDPHLVAINLSRNHGHQLALTAGLDLCAGERVLIIDADLQDPPELLADMLATMEERDADVVYAVRRKREGETVVKKATAALFYRVLDRVTDTVLGLDGRGNAALFADYLQWEQWRAASANPQPKLVAAAAKPAPPAPAKKKLSYIEQREFDSIDALIQAADDRLAAAKQRLEDPSVATDPAALTDALHELESAQSEHDRLLERWLELSEK